MAKKRRKPHNRQTTPRAGVRTAERPVGTETTARPGRAAPAAHPRAEKKELARRQREEVRRRIRRAERVRRFGLVFGLAVVVGAAVFFFMRPDEPSVRPRTLPGELTTEAPWPPNAGEAEARAEAIDLPTHGQNLAMHEHVNLRIFVNGAEYPVPTDLGINAASGFVASIHTHEGSGTVHIESSTVDTFTLGDVFDIWGVRLTDSCLGAYCNSGEERLRLFQNGEELEGPIRDVVLEDQSVLVVAYGTDDELPDPIPSTFDFGSVPQ